MLEELCPREIEPNFKPAQALNDGFLKQERNLSREHVYIIKLGPFSSIKQLLKNDTLSGTHSSKT